MAYVDINTPVVEEIVLPSGNTYYVADREIRDVVQTLSETIAGGVSYIVAWDGASTPVVANIPAGVKVTYNGTTYTGTLAANSAQAGAFYLIKSSTTPSGETLDIYDEYVPVGSAGSKTWEKIGDTKIDLSDVVTGVTLNKQTDTVIGSDATFTVTQPNISVVGDAGTTGFGVVTGVGGSLLTDTVSAVTGLGTPTTKNAIGASSTFTVTQPTVALTSNTSAATGRVEVLSGVRSGIPTILGATASGGAVSASGTVAVPDTVEAEEVSVIKTVTPTSSRLATTSIYGVGSSTTTASKATAATSQTTATGGTTASTVNTNLLKGISVTNGVLTFGAATLNTQTTTQQTFSDVTVPVKNSSATTVATGAAAAAGSGTDIVIAVTSTNATVAGTDIQLSGSSSALKSDATFTVTPPTVSLYSISGSSDAPTSDETTIPTQLFTNTYLGATASGGNVAWNSKDTVAAVTGYASPTTANVLGEETDIEFNVTTDKIAGRASGGNVAWNNKDTVTVLKNTTDVNVTKGS